MDAVPKSDWANFFNRASSGLTGLRAEVEIAGLDIGDQIEASSLPIHGISYDHKDDVIAVAIEGIDHLIRHPQSVYADLGPQGLTSIAVIDSDGTNHLIKITKPVALPPPASPESSAANQGERK